MMVPNQKGIPDHDVLSKMVKDINEIDNSEAEEWNKELDTLLVFAALFSAVVTGLSVEQLKSLKEDPTEITATILKNLIKGNFSEPAPFHSTASDVAINTLWSLSLVLSLASALFALMCKQWIREHRRKIDTRSDAESAALRWLRTESLKKWHIPFILSALPLLLQMSLLLFVVGLLIILYDLHPIPFAFSFAAIAITGSFYVITALIPSVTLAKRAVEIANHDPNASVVEVFERLPPIQYVCPYKSPQAMSVFAMTRYALGTWPVQHFIYWMLSKRRNFSNFHDRLQDHLRRISDWPSLDLYIIRSFDDITSELNVPLYELEGLGSLVKASRNRPSYLEEVFGKITEPLAPLVAMSSFDQWKLPAWTPITPTDLQQCSKESPHFSSKRQSTGLDPQIKDHRPSFRSSLFVQMLSYYSFWNAMTINWDSAYELTKKLYALDGPRRAGIPFVVPFHKLEKILIPPPAPQQNNPPNAIPNPPNVIPNPRTSLRFLEFYKEGWKIASGIGTHDRLALVKALANHIVKADNKSSVLTTTQEGLDFLKFVHEKIIEDELYGDGQWEMENMIRDWKIAVERVKQRVGELGGGLADNFREIPNRNNAAQPVIQPIQGWIWGPWCCMV